MSLATATRSGETKMKWHAKFVSLVNQSRFLQWANQWWLGMITQCIGVIYLASYFLPNRGLDELSLKMVYVLGAAVWTTAIVQGSIWLWRRRIS